MTRIAALCGVIETFENTLPEEQQQLVRESLEAVVTGTILPTARYVRGEARPPRRNWRKRLALRVLRSP